jgi:predicted lipoprotein with Yx(FWY)xxD motif
MIDGSAVFVNSAQLPVYTYSSDTAGNSTCTGGCLAAWPAVLAPSGTLPTPWASFTRGDNGQVQLEYNGKPLYTFVADSADTANGNGDVVGNGTFELAHPLADPTSAPTTDPTIAPAPIGGY